jgi:hypothetical protein
VTSVPTALYRLFGDGDALLYIGIARIFGRRWHQHAQSRSWWPEVRRQTVDWHPSRELAAAAEVQATGNERPKYNIQHASKSIAGSTPAQPAAARIRMTAGELRALPVTLDLTEVAKIIGPGRSKAHELVRADGLPCPVLRLGNRYRVTKAAFIKALDVEVLAESSAA